MVLTSGFIAFLGITLVSAYNLTSPVQLMENKGVKKWCFPRIKAHGNWCGPCHTGKSPSTRCIDRLDCACRAHDLCFRRYFTDYCQCDVSFVKRLKTIGGSKAKLFRTLFKLKTCMIRVCKRKTCYGYTCNNQRRCGSNKVCTKIRIRRTSDARNKCWITVWNRYSSFVLTVSTEHVHYLLKVE